MADLDQAPPLFDRCLLRAGSWAEGERIPSLVRASAMAYRPRPAMNSVKILWTTGAALGSISRRRSCCPIAALLGLGWGPALTRR